MQSCLKRCHGLLESQQSQRYRGIGSQLAAFLQRRSGSFPEPGVLQGVVADLAASNEELIVPLKALVSRPGFRALAGLAGSGKGEVQRQALLQELTATFSPQVISALSDLLGGFLALPEGQNDGAAAAGRPRPATTEQADVPQATASRAAPPSPQDVASEPAAGPEGPSLGVLVLAAMAAALLALAGMVVLRSPRFCGAVGLCPAPSASTASQQALDAASAAEQELRRVTDLEGYRSAVERLERELLKLSGDPLTDVLEQRRRQLQGVASDARQTLRLEEADQERLKRAVAAVDQAKQLTGEEQGEQIAAARQELDGIRPRSFAAAEAGRVRERLAELLSRPSPPEESRESPAPQREQPAAEPQPQRSWSPPPVPSRPAAPSGSTGGSAPYRDQPLF